MANRVKEDEKNERIIRGLLKLPVNRKCINCNSLGPQYVCTNFSIFICTNCSGIHREFTHRVKSVSMAKFTSQEVTNLQEGGNERAKEVFFKEWDPQRHSFPDSSNVEKLRTFIKHVYVDRRYTGEKPVDKPPRVKGDREDYEQRKPDTFRSDSRSPPYDDVYDRRYNDRPSSGGRNDDRNSRYNYDERRSPGYDQGDHRRSPGYFEVVDDRRRDDKFGNANQNRRFEDRRFPDGAQKPEGSSPNHQKNIGSPPVVRPVRDILGDDAPALQVGEPLKSNGARVIESPPMTQSASTSTSGSTVANPIEQKTASAISLIDFDANPEPSVAAATEQSVAPQTSPLASEANWASFDSVTVPKAPQTVTSLNTLESVLSQFSDSGSASTSNTALPSNTGTDSSAMTMAGQLPNVQQKELLFSQTSSQFTVPPFTPSLVGGPSDQLRIPSVATNVSGSLTAFAGQTTQIFHAPTVESNAAVSSLPNTESKPSGRKELPVDLFASAYPTSHPSMMGWHARPNFGMGFSIQYPPQVTPSFPYSSKSANPFDVSGGPTLAPVSTFPSLASLQGALPNPANSSDISKSVNFGATPFSQMMPQNHPPHSSMVVPGGYVGQQYQSSIPGQQFQSSIPGQQFQGSIPGQQFQGSIPGQQFQSSIPGQQFQGSIPGQQFQGSIPQQAPNNMFPMGSQGIGSVPIQMAAFGPTAAMNTGFSQPGTPNAIRPAGGNPFG